MAHIFTYNDPDLYVHHTLDPHPHSEEFAMHAHEWMEILYFISGSGSYLVEGNQYPLEPHDVFILQPGEMHRLQIEPDQPYERIVIHFSPDLFEAIDPDRTLLRAFQGRMLGQQNRYSQAADPDGLLPSAFAGFTFDHVPNIRANLIGRLLILLTALDGLRCREEIHLPEQGIQTQLVTYVNEHLFEDISVQSIADAFYRSRSQISRIFHQATGSSLWDYIILKRLMAARAMIQQGEAASTACTACGFSDYSAFYRAYRAHFGNSPREDAAK